MSSSCSLTSASLFVMRVMSHTPFFWSRTATLRNAIAHLGLVELAALLAGHQHLVSDLRGTSGRAILTGGCTSTSPASSSLRMNR